MKKNPLRILALLASVFLSGQAIACASCGCTLSADGALGYSTTGGWNISLDDSYIDQSQLYTGSGRIAPAQVQTVPDQEVENRTVNRYLTLGLGYNFNADWNIKLALPYIDRSHSTYGDNATLPLNDAQLSSAGVTGIGDVKLMASYQGLLPTANLGIQVGLKLPTGNYGGPSAANTTGRVDQGVVGRHPAQFGPDGNAGSTYLDTSLNAGNGSTDLILGSYYYQAVSQNLDAFVNGQLQVSVLQQLHQSGADYRPGNQVSASMGLRYMADPSVIPQLQINLVNKASDSGALADTTGTAGTLVYFSPGLTMTVQAQTQIYGFIQLPVLANLSGYQLVPRYTASLGISHHF